MMRAKHCKKAGNMQLLVSLFLVSYTLTGANSESQTANWLDDNNNPLGKGLIVSGWGLASMSRNPWQRPLSVAQTGNYKRSGKGSSTLCTSGKTKRAGSLLQRLQQDEGDSVLFKEEENGVVEADVMLIPWMRPLPEDFAKTDSDSEIVDATGLSGAMPTKRGWEGVTTCGCCTLGQMSSCCRWCRGITNQSSARKTLSTKTLHKGTTKKHVKSFIQSTMCMCCYRAQIDVCCSLCKTGIDKVTCC